MDKEANQETPSLLSNHTTAVAKEDSPRKTTPTGGGGGDRLKRDEWSEGAVSCLLEAYEAKWILRNRAKLKGQDWEDVAKYVSSRSNYTKSSKTQTQCKNKIESMKKRYRSESATADASSWPLFQRLDLLLRGSAPPLHALPPPPPPPPPASAPLVVVETATPPPPPPIAPPAPLATVPLGIAQQNSHGSNGVDRVSKEDGDGTKLSDDKNHPSVETDSSTPAAFYSDEEKTTKWKSLKTTRAAEKKKRRRRGVAESIRWLAEVVVQSEQTRMETMRELEKMRAEMEAKRAEMDLKRTEIIANTQLEIARLFAAGFGKGIESSLRIGRS